MTARVPPSGFRAVVFDMDGVLVDSAALHARAFREAFGDGPYRGVEIDYPRIAGMRTDDAVRVLLAEAGAPASDAIVAEHAAKKRARYAAIAHLAPIFPDAIEVVRAVASSVRAGLASSGSEASVAAFVEAAKLRDAFHCILHGDCVRAAKPAPDIYLLAAERLGAAPSEVLVVEDSASGAKAAIAAEMAVAVLRPSERTLAALEPHRYFAIQSLYDVIRLVRGSS